MIMDFITRRRAYWMLRNGRNFKGLFKLIKPYVLNKDPDALYIYSCFTLPEWNEDESTFFKRRFKYVRHAAKVVADVMAQIRVLKEKVNFIQPGRDKDWFGQWAGQALGKKPGAAGRHRHVYDRKEASVAGSRQVA